VASGKEKKIPPDPLLLSPSGTSGNPTPSPGESYSYECRQPLAAKQISPSSRNQSASLELPQD